ncbi:hypothetical protein IRZ83_01555 [Flavobacterium sp. JLP]|uniref:hypothetical protein n=1 Tax=unclassified Flavobacterium TaxID=196869 RepID=UPI00068AD606|nr:MULTISPECIES: hypothetical protein [unclassified Flavobacterium]MBF4491211.1 hypothetical protein [Flavobacterium sp. MR2016-29]MBF4505332.1 hypothetical protein [Flavobacterium sp. JLP]
MENQINHDYGQTDPDFIDQNTLIDGHHIENNDQFQKQLHTENKSEFGESDPDYLEQNTLVDHDNYARDEDPYEAKEEFIEQFKNPESDLNVENKSDQEEITNTDENLEEENKKESNPEPETFADDGYKID